MPGEPVGLSRRCCLVTLLLIKSMVFMVGGVSGLAGGDARLW